jgi:hypothetical protein
VLGEQQTPSFDSCFLANRPAILQVVKVTAAPDFFNKLVILFRADRDRRFWIFKNSQLLWRDIGRKASSKNS